MKIIYTTPQFITRTFGKISPIHYKDLGFVLSLYLKELKIKTELGKFSLDSKSTRIASSILRCMKYIFDTEIIGWRSKHMTRTITKQFITPFISNRKLTLFAIFCPSYKKGTSSFGFKTDGVGETTKKGLKNLVDFYHFVLKNNIPLNKPLGLFFDVAVENYQKVVENNGLKDLCVNFENLKKEAKKTSGDLVFRRISRIPFLLKKIGYQGITKGPLPISNETYRRILERGKKFYKLFGWNEKQVISRTKVIARSECLVGTWIKKNMTPCILVYTPTMLERGEIYSGNELKRDPFPIYFPKK